MKITVPDYYQYCPLKNVSKNAPGKKIILWGKITEYFPDKHELTLINSNEQEKISISLLSVDQEKILINEKGKIVKVFGIVKMDGIELQKIIPWNSDEDQLSKLTKVLSE
ncbi:MAG: hypothetical protein HeimC3_12790 [Candidatus Heimdallarchaeota archaeon LC_3]|nr:MAG: hypothetical protein HeimC3_12790 [Candidatus Heimdallarchaeota archaeon LC_3]